MDREKTKKERDAASAAEPVGRDLDGYEPVTAALRALLERYPRLDEGEHIAFATLDKSGGVAMYPGGAEGAAGYPGRGVAAVPILVRGGVEDRRAG